MSRQRRKGTATETAVVRYLQANGWPHAERRALHGAADKGDIAGLPIAIEVKAVTRPAYQAWLREAETEAANAGTPTGVVVHRPHGTSIDKPEQFIVAMRLADLIRLLNP